MAEEKNPSATVKFLYGSRAGIESKVEDGTIDGSDIIITSDTDEFVFVDKTKAIKPMKSRTVNEYVLNGTDIGALADGATIEAGIDLDEFIAMICQKEIPAEYTKPTVAISVASGDKAGNYEVGTEINTALKGTFTKNDAGLLASIEIIQDGTSILSQAVSPITTDTVTFNVGEGTNVFKAKATYGEGLVKDNNLGKPSPEGHIAAGSIETTVNVEFRGKRNAFYGTGVGDVPKMDSVAVRALSSKTLAPANGTVLTIPVEVGQQYVVFAYPATLRDVKEVMYVETNDTGMAANFDMSTVSVEGANGTTAIPYKVYTYGMASPAKAPMTFKATI